MMKIMYGSNRLIAEGEKCILGPDDILNHYINIKKLKTSHENGKGNQIENQIEKESRTKINLEESLERIYKIISKRKIGIDEICQKLNCNASEILPKLTILELKELVVRYPGNLYSKKIM